METTVTAITLFVMGGYEEGDNNLHIFKSVSNGRCKWGENGERKTLSVAGGGERSKHDFPDEKIVGCCFR